MIRKILLGFVLVLGLSVQSQTKKPVQSFDTKVKNYVQWFESLPDSKKREESRILVNKLNMMSPSDKGMWLATMEKYSKKAEYKKNVVDSLSNEEVKKRLFENLKINNKGIKIDSIVIVRSSTAKERTVAKNTRIRKKIAEHKIIIEKAQRLLDSIPNTENNDWTINNAKSDIEIGKRNISDLRQEIITYDGTKDERWNSYLIDSYIVEMHISVPHKQTDEELDSGISSGVKFDKEIENYTAYFSKGYKYNGDNKERNDHQDSSFNVNYYGKGKKDGEKDGEEDGQIEE
jgi:hypothetical protein